MFKEQKIDEKAFSFIEDIAFFRDISNDIEENPFEKDLKKLEQEAFGLLEQYLKQKEGFERVNVVIIGNFSSGKSTLINSLLGKPVCPMGVGATTSCVTKFVYSDKPQIILEKENKEISQEEYLQLSQHKGSKGKRFDVEYKYPFEQLRNIAIYDTPGFHNPNNPNDDIVTEEIFKEFGDVVFFVHDVNTPEIQKDTLDKLKAFKTLSPNADWYLILNKSEGKSESDRKKIKMTLEKKYNNLFKEIFFYSAKQILELEQSKHTFSQLNKKINSFISQEIENSNPDFKLEIIGEKKGITGKKYGIEVKNTTTLFKTEILKNNNQFEQVRDSLIKILNYISEGKTLKLKRKFEFREEKYEEKKKNLLKKFVNFIEATIQENLNSDGDMQSQIDFILESTDSLEFDYTKILTDDELYNTIYSFLKVKTIKGSGIFFDDAKLKIKPNKLSEFLLAFWQEYYYEHLRTEIENIFSEAGLWESVHNNLIKMLDTSFENEFCSQYLPEIPQQIKSELSEKIFYDDEEAEQKKGEEILNIIYAGLYSPFAAFIEYAQQTIKDYLISTQGEINGFLANENIKLEETIKKIKKHLKNI